MPRNWLSFSYCNDVPVGLVYKSGIIMFLDWFTLTGFLAVLGLVGLLLYFCKTKGCGA
jgi:hypothetical protein